MIKTTGRQTIRTTYKGPTNHNGSRFIARCEAGRITVPFDYALNASDNHKAAAEALIKKLGWDELDDWAGGRTNSSEFVFVATPRATQRGS